MSIRTAIRDWLNKPSDNEVRARALEARLNEIECETAGLVKRALKRACRVTGRAAEPWWPVS